MRRSTLGIFLVALALLGRVLAPMAAEARAFDRMLEASICSHDGSGATTPDQDGDGGHRHQVCQFACCQIAPALDNPPTSPVVTLTRVASLVVWNVRADAATITRVIAANRARGPPTVS